jgi:hypothetical protein
MDKDVPDHVSTRIISQREALVDGVLFQWWAVGERPALVTVRTPVFGSATEFTLGPVEACAHELAKKLLAQHYERAAVAKAQARSAPQSPLDKPGWFEPGNTDYSSTTTILELR